MLLSLQNFRVNNRIVRVLLVAMLIFCMVFCAFVYQVETAHALVAELAIAGVVSSLLISVGFAYSTPAQWDSVVDSFTNFMNKEATKEVVAIASAWTDFQKPGFVFHATPAIISSLASWINKYWNSDSGSVVIPGSGLTIDGISMSKVPIFSKNLASSSQSDYDLFISMAYPLYDLNNLPADGEKVLRVPLSKSAITKYPAGTSAWLIYRPGPPHGCFLHYTDSSGSIVGSEPILGGTSGYNKARTVAIYKAESGNYYLTLGKYIFSSNDYNLHDYGPLTGAVATGSVESKPNSTYFPKEVVGSSSGTTIFPNNTSSKPLTSDTPLTIPEAGVNSGTTVGDIRGDIQEQTTTITGWLSKLWDAIQSIPGALAGAIAGFFTPPLGMWDGFVDDAVKIMSPPGSVDFTNYVSSISIPDVTGKYKGKTLTFVDNQKLRDNIVTWRQYIGAFLAFLLVLYNYNMFSKFMGYGSLSLTDSGRVRHEPVDINNLSGVGLSLPPPKGGR